MKKFVLVGTQRSGTTFIRHCLNSHTDILCHGELFFKNYPDDAGYFIFKQKAAMGCLKHMLLRPFFVKKYLDDYYSQGAYKAIGYKLMYSQIRWLPYSFPSALNYIKDNSISVIHVVRDNVLKTHLSREVARKRKIYHAKSQTSIKKIKLDTSHLIAELKKIQAENVWWKDTFADFDYLAVSYETFVKDKEGESERLLDFLDIENHQELVSSNVKITSDALADVIENIEDVESCLDNSEFAYCLDKNS